MHTSVLEWAPTVLTREAVTGRRVLEVGAYNVNGSVRPIVEAHGPALYLGVDICAGPGVDRIVDATRLLADLGETFDVVISTEMLEHVQQWQPIVAELVETTAPGGLLILTTRSPGFPYHPYPIDTWRYTVDGLGAVLRAAGLADVTTQPDPDPQSPGVFATARKPSDWTRPWPSTTDAAGVLPHAGVTPMQPA